MSLYIRVEFSFLLRMCFRCVLVKSLNRGFFLRFVFLWGRFLGSKEICIGEVGLLCGECYFLMRRGGVGYEVVVGDG